MNEPKQTPGPWFIGPNKTQVYDKNIWYDESGIRYGETPNMIVDIEPFNPANARLIATAPELLDTCQRVLDAIEHNLTDDTLPETRAALRAAIAKATGESQT